MTLVARARSLAHRLHDRYEHTVPLQLVLVFLRIEGRDRTLMLAGQAFIAVIPILIVVATISGADGSSGVGSYLVNRFGLDGSAEESVRVLFDRPPGATGGVTLVSVVVLLFTTNSFARSLQRTFCAAGELPRRAPGANACRALGLLVLLVVLFGVSWFGNLVGAHALPRVAGIVAQLLVVVGGWALATHLFLARRESLRLLLPGAAASAVVQLVVGWGTALRLPRLIARNAESYGSIGVALALVSWLIVVAASIVASAVIGSVLAKRRSRSGLAAHPPDRRG
ncbi:YihY/virulence factor BrkB family protein [Nocardioides KLBMP 9356]|uniref:YihY/virulence factor BrkB family protein n=1 Tax=Nocardioides potassii TaxID=2911371 RepID=A0ABS9HGQ5_9ACTN|nr:YhjD/YihY/BrkB family envelope integrity protein [Nocardioides potassii]MCF6379298.1 YihY/virulence factor BrkB family protein [Nocardioides potassii]